MNTKLRDEIALKQARAFLDSLTSSAFRDAPPEAMHAVERVRKSRLKRCRSSSPTRWKSMV